MLIPLALAVMVQPSFDCISPTGTVDLASGPNGIAVADFNGDGIPDLATTIGSYDRTLCASKPSSPPDASDAQVS